MGFFGEEQRIAIWDMWSNWETCPSPELKSRRPLLSWTWVGLLETWCPLEEAESTKHSDSSLAELLLGKEGSFLPPAEVGKYHFL